MVLGLRRLSGWLLIVLAGVTPSADTNLPLVIADVTLIDGNGGPPAPHMTLVIVDGLIADIFPSYGKPLPAGADVLNAQGQHVVPGLIDSHVHLTSQPDQARSRLALALRGGVTAVRDMGGDTALLSELSETSAAPLADAPRVYFAVALAGPTLLGAPRAAPTLTSTGLFSITPWLSTFTPYTPARRTVEFITSTGASGIKIYSDIPTNRVADLAVEAHRQGLKVWGHARIFPGKPSDTVEAGFDVISHSGLLACEDSATGRECDHRGSTESGPLTRLFDAMHERQTILEPTLAIQRFISVMSGGNPKRRGSASMLEWGEAAARRAHGAGVRIAAGSDLLLVPGASFPAIHDELELLVTRAGLTPLEALTAATRTGAEILGLERTSGTLEVGKQAHVVILSANPIADIRNTRLVTHVVKGGRIVRPAIDSEKRSR